MTTKTLFGTYSAGYEVHAPVTILSLTAAGYVSGKGIASPSPAIGAYTIVNNGRVKGAVDGVFLHGGGSVTDASTSPSASIIGATVGVQIAGATGAVLNDGLIKGGAGTAGVGVYLTAGGSLTNGSSSQTKSLVQGGDGVEIKAKAGTIANFGTILGDGTSLGQGGVVLGAGGVVTNGDGADSTAVIEGASIGVLGFAASATVTNFGVIRGQPIPGYPSAGLYLVGGFQVTNGTSKNTGALIEGTYGAVVYGRKGVVTNFGTLEGTSGAGLVLFNKSTGGNLINGGATDSKALIEGRIGAEIYGAGALTNFGTIIGKGGEAVVFKSAGSKLVAEAGSEVIGAAVVGGDVIDVVSGTATFAGGIVTSGVVEGAGALALTGGTTAVDGGASLTVARLVLSGGATKLDVATKLTYARAWTQTGGTVSVGSADQLTFTGVADTFAGTLTGPGTIDFAAGSDTLRGVSLTASHVVIAATVTAVGATATTLTGALANTGMLVTSGATLAVDGAVSGGGGVRVVGAATAQFASTFAENVAFSGAGGLLKLSKSSAYAGTITGFSKTGANSLDLGDIVFHAGTTKASYSGTTSSGVLTVTDGVHTAKIELSGDYLGSTFTPSSDGHGGTKIVDPWGANDRQPAAPAPMHRFIAAAAGFGPAAVSTVTVGNDRWPTAPPALSGPRMQIA